MNLLKIVFAIVLTLGLGVSAGLSTQENDPYPVCSPCPYSR